MSTLGDQGQRDERDFPLVRHRIVPCMVTAVVINVRKSGWIPATGAGSSYSIEERANRRSPKRRRGVRGPEDA